MLKRRKKLLGLLHMLGGRMGKRDFQKLLFLYCMEFEEDPSFQFVPYKYGGFSFTSYADRRKLVAAGMLADDDQAWRLTEAGEDVAKEQQLYRPEMEAFHSQMRLRGPKLVAETYRRHPYYATRSEIVGQLKLSVKELDRIEASRPARQEPALLTIGYEGRSLEDYLNTLLRAGVTLLCDVRRNPLSRKYGFSKRALSGACEGVGIRYEHVPELGIDSERRRALNAAADYAALFKAYKHDTLAGCEDILRHIGAWIQDGGRVALTCYERDPAMCHRHCVGDALMRLDSGLECIEHL